MTSPRIIAALAATAVTAGALLTATPALAMTPRAVTPGWNPVDPPTDPAGFAFGFPYVLYTVSCGSLTATGWSADVADDTNFRAMLVTTSDVATACALQPGTLVVKQGDDTVPASPWVFDAARGFGSIAVVPNEAFIDWDFVPTPTAGQWVALQGRAADGSPLPMLERRITAVGTDTFTIDEPVGAEYLGAPVVDNMARGLGVVTRSGIDITGAPQFCDTLFYCTDPTRVWWDITAPSVPRGVKAKAGKGRITFRWKPVADDGGDDVAYWYRIGSHAPLPTDRFAVTFTARKGQRVKFSVVAVNHAGPGPTVTIYAKAT